MNEFCSEPNRTETGKVKMNDNAFCVMLRKAFFIAFLEKLGSRSPVFGMLTVEGDFYFISHEDSYAIGVWDVV